MKKFLNRPENAVEEMLQGLTVLSPGTFPNSPGIHFDRIWVETGCLKRPQ
jgi:hypothetical protein